MVRRLAVTAIIGSGAVVGPAVAQAAPRPATEHGSGAARSVATATKPPATISATPAVLYVNGTTGSDSGNTCRLFTRPCATITQALSIAQPNEQIDVAGGVYPEQLNLTQNVTIKGTGSPTGGNPTIIEPQSLTTSETDTDSTTPQAVIVMVEPGVTADLTNLEINGGGTNGAAAASFNDGCLPDYVGVYYRDASGLMTSDVVTGVEQEQADFGCQPGANGGIYVATDSSATAPSSGAGTTGAWVAPPAGWSASDVTMTRVTVNQYDKNGITCDDVGTACAINSSTVTGLGAIPTNSETWANNAQNGIQVWGANANIASTKVTGNNYTAPQYDPPANDTYYTASGILVINSGSLTISHSTVEQNNANIYALWYPGGYGISPASQGTWSITDTNANDGANSTGEFAGTVPVPLGDGFGDGIDLDGAGQDSGTETLTGNTASSGAEYGIGLFATTAATLTSNRTNSNGGDGIYVGDDPATGTSGIAGNIGDSTGDTLMSNTALFDKGDGILADTTADLNTFSQNTLVFNDRYDAEDLSLGSGTDGTDNTWTSNVCFPAGDASPEAICR
jgi:hypothetical protein